MAKRAPELPARANPLAQRIGAKMKLVREARGLGAHRAAEQLGIPYGLYTYLESGAIVGTPEVYRRVYQWAIGGYHFEGAGKPNAANGAKARSKWWRTVRVALPLDVAKQLRKKSNHLGMSMGGLAMVYIEQGLLKKAGFGVMGDAIEAVRQSEALNLLQEVPEIKDLLTAEIDMCTKAGAELTSWAALEVKKPDIEKVAEIPTRHLRLDNEESYEEEL